MTLYPDDAEEVVAFVAAWRPQPVARVPDGLIVVDDLEQAMAMLHQPQWLLLGGEQMDDERLRLRNLKEAACSDRVAALAIARPCEDLCERFEGLIVELLERWPSGRRHPVLRNHLYSAFNNIAGIRLLDGIHPDRFAERLFACYRQDLVPVGYQGEWPDGRFAVWPAAGRLTGAVSPSGPSQ